MLEVRLVPSRGEEAIAIVRHIPNEMGHTSAVALARQLAEDTEWEVIGVRVVEGPSHMLDVIAASNDPGSLTPVPTDARVADGIIVTRHIVRDHPRGNNGIKWYTVAGQRVQGTLERRFAEACERLAVPWRAHHKRAYPWVDAHGVSHWYQPDFYMPGSGAYVEIKGYWHPGAQDKMARVFAQNPGAPIHILYQADIELLEQQAGTV